MNPIQKVTDWSERNRDIMWDFFRIAFGVGLFLKGISLLHASDAIASDAVAHGLPFAGGTAVYLAALLHFVGGTMMVIGLFTRVAALIQIPNILMAMAFVHQQDGGFTGSQGFVLRLLVLSLLVIFAFVGAGRISTEWYFTDRPHSLPEERREVLAHEVEVRADARKARALARTSVTTSPNLGLR